MLTPENQKRLEEIEAALKTHLMLSKVDVEWLCSELRKAWEEIGFLKKNADKIQVELMTRIESLESQLTQANAVIEELEVALKDNATEHCHNHNYIACPCYVRSQKALQKVKEMRK